MKILVFGAGVLGSVYAARLAQAGHSVTVIGRGKRLEDLQRNGIVLEEWGSSTRQVVPVRSASQLDPAEAFDLALVVVRKNQLDSVLPSLAANPNIPDILFLFNNPAGPQEMVRAVGRRRVLIGFPGGGGQRDGQVVRYILSGRRGQPTTIGELDGQTSTRLVRIAGALEGAGFPVEICSTMDAWLKTHFALIGPLANAVYLAGGDGRRLSRTRDGLVLLVRAVREGLQVLHALGIPIVPERMRLLEWIPEPILVAVLQRVATSQRFELAAIRHAMAARDEMLHLEEEFRFLGRLSGVPTPALDELAFYVDPQTPLMPDGQSHLHQEWRGVWTLLAAGAAALLVLGRLGRNEN